MVDWLSDQSRVIDRLVVDWLMGSLLFFRKTGSEWQNSDAGMGVEVEEASPPPQPSASPLCYSLPVFRKHYKKPSATDYFVFNHPNLRARESFQLKVTLSRACARKCCCVDSLEHSTKVQTNGSRKGRGGGGHHPVKSNREDTNPGRRLASSLPCATLLLERYTDNVLVSE